MTDAAAPSRPPTFRKDLLTIPNLLSSARLLVTPVLCWLILSGHRLAAFAVLGAMGVSDNLDGRIARATRTVSELGIILDPTSDRVLIMAALVTLMIKGTLPLWMGVPVLARDVVVSVVFLVLARTGFGKAAVKTVGKAGTFGLLTALPALVFGGALKGVGLLLFGAGGVLYFLAAFAYARDIAVWLGGRRHERTPPGLGPGSPGRIASRPAEEHQ